MGYILLALSALALAGAGFLWRADAQEKQEQGDAGRDGAARRDEAAVPSEQQAPNLNDEAELAHGGQAEQAEQVESAEQDEPVEPEEPEEPVPGTERESESEPAEPAKAVHTPNTEEAAAPGAPAEPAEAAKEAEAPEESHVTEQSQAPEQHSPRTAEKTHSRWGALSGAISGALPGAKQRGRKERREWAEANGFEYSRDDEFLQDEWGRGAASIGAPVRDVLTGTRFGHETRIADIGETTVVAMGTGMDSGVVVDVRRKANADGATEDLVAVAELEGFRVFASEAGPAERMLDIRVTTALEMLPPQVSAVWFETEWVLAQLDGTPGAQEWEPVFAPLALLADAARTLPPRTWPHLHFDGKTREMGDPVEAPASAKGEGSEHARPVVARPEEPLELPTRTTGAVRGTMEYRTVGGDEVDAIATGAPPEQLNDGTRLTRRPQPPSIFGDSNADYPG